MSTDQRVTLLMTRKMEQYKPPQPVVSSIDRLCSLSSHEAERSVENNYLP